MVYVSIILLTSSLFMICGSDSSIGGGAGFTGCVETGSFVSTDEDKGAGEGAGAGVTGR